MPDRAGMCLLDANPGSVARISGVIEAIHVPIELIRANMVNRLKRNDIAVCELNRKCSLNMKISSARP
jgi:hypothetical protein